MNPGMENLDENLITIPFGASREREDNPRYRWDNHERGGDSFVIFQYTHSGRGEIAFGGRDHPVPPGHAFIATVPEASCYAFPRTAPEPWIFSWLNFYGDLALQLWRGLRDRVGPVVPLSPSSIRLLESLIVQAKRRQWRDPYEASGAAYAFYLEIMRHARPTAPTLGLGPSARTIAYLRRHYQEPLRMKEVAAVAGVSREHFSRLFFKQTGESPAAFLRTIRLEAAARLLRSTDQPIYEIALRSGFPNASKLGLFFRRRYRMSPRVYRQKGVAPASAESKETRPGKGSGRGPKRVRKKA